MYCDGLVVESYNFRFIQTIKDILKHHTNYEKSNSHLI